MTEAQELTQSLDVITAAVEHPKYYILFADGSMESIDAIETLLTPEEFRGFLKGNILKYRFRAGGKDDVVQDIRKAQQYNKMLADYSNKTH